MDLVRYLVILVTSIFVGPKQPIICPLGFVGDQCRTECGITYSNQNQNKIVGGSNVVPYSLVSF